MYEYIQGSLAAVCADYLVLDACGIGYKIFMPRAEKSRALPLGSTLKLHIDLIIREDSHTLYGFSSEIDRDLFRMLLQVNGIGPKVAINIMSGTSATQLATALHRKDIAFLSKIPGIGKKLAERLIVELHEKISSFAPKGSALNESASNASLDACKALETLGLSSHESRELISQVQTLHPNDATVEGMLQRALSIKRGVKA